MEGGRGALADNKILPGQEKGGFVFYKAREKTSRTAQSRMAVGQQCRGEERNAQEPDMSVGCYARDLMTGGSIITRWAGTPRYCPLGLSREVRA